MTEKLKIILTCAGVFIVVVIAAILFPYDAVFGPRGRAGPDIEVLGHRWASEVFDGDGATDDEPAHNTYAIWVNLDAPETFHVTDHTVNHTMLIEMCNAVLAATAELVPEGVTLGDLDHVDVNFRIGGQKAFPYDATVVLENGLCINAFRYDILSSRLDTKFSQHEPIEEGTAIMQAWGMKQGKLKFSNKNGHRSIEVNYEPLSEFDRDIASINVSALCILTLATMDKEMSVLGIKIDPSKYSEMKVSIAKTSGGGFASFTKKYGSATLSLSDGKCGGKVEGT